MKFIILFYFCKPFVITFLCLWQEVLIFIYGSHIEFL